MQGRLNVKPSRSSLLQTSSRSLCFSASNPLAAHREPLSPPIKA
ncbi:MAG: hypothetical protein QXR81_07095 [Candidatus Nezhaarchaeales archaeon]